MKTPAYLLTLTLGAGIGFVTGYVAERVAVISRIPFVHQGPSILTGFDREVEDFAKLGAYESVAANCDRTSPVEKALLAQNEVINDLQQLGTKDAVLLNVEQAKLFVRASALQSELGIENPSASTKTEKLLKDAEWTHPTQEQMKQVIKELDRDQCTQVHIGASK